MIEIIAEVKDRFGPPMKKAREINKIISVWTTNFPKLIKLTKKEK